jgi:hypothetical protein
MWRGVAADNNQGLKLQQQHANAPDIPGIFFAHEQPHQSDRIASLTPEERSYESAHTIVKTPGAPPTKLAVVTTVFKVNEQLNDWIRYYLEEVKLDVAIVFIDYPVERGKTSTSACTITDEGEEICEATKLDSSSDDLDGTPTEESLRTKWGHQKLHLVRRGPALDAELEAIGTELYDRYGGFYPFEVQARQLLHFGWVASRANELGVDWALHLDLDELWLLPEDEKAQSHFSNLNRDKVTQAIYSNMEVLPLKEDLKEGESIFSQTQFLRSEMCIYRQEHYEQTNTVRLERQVATGKQMFYQGYWAGKTASRISTGTIFPHDVCRNAIPPSTWDVAKFAVFDDMSGPLVLHYISTGPEAWRAKYTLLGDVSDRSFDPSRIDPSFLEKRPDAAEHFPPSTTKLPFERISRDQVEKQLPIEVLDWYRTNMCIASDREESLREAGVLVEIRDVVDIMTGWDDHADKATTNQAATKFRPQTSAPASTCPQAPHFQCHVRSKHCCQFLSSNAFMFMLHQLGYRGKRMQEREDWLRQREKRSLAYTT